LHIQKIEKRLGALKTSGWTSSRKERVQRVLTIEVISSEDSFEERDLDGRVVKKVLRRKNLPWRSNKCTKYFRSLDKKYMSKLSFQGFRQVTPVEEGGDSLRPAPQCSADLKWVLK
jgi:hypothetical protein